MNRLRPLLRIMLALLMLNFAACSSWQMVSVESGMRYSPPPGVDFGSLVKVQTFDNRKANFRVTEITDAGLGGNQGFYEYADMKSLKVDRSVQREGDTAAIILGILGVAALVWLVGNADSVTICSPPCGDPQP